MDSPVIVDKASEFGEPIDLDRPFRVSGAIFSFFLLHSLYRDTIQPLSIINVI